MSPLLVSLRVLILLYCYVSQFGYLFFGGPMDFENTTYFAGALAASIPFHDGPIRYWLNVPTLIAAFAVLGTSILVARHLIYADAWNHDAAWRSAVAYGMLLSIFIYLGNRRISQRRGMDAKREHLQPINSIDTTDTGFGNRANRNHSDHANDA